MAAYTIEYVNRRMIVTHASGVIAEYTLTELNDIKDMQLEERSRIDAIITEIDTYIAGCEASVMSP